MTFFAELVTTVGGRTFRVPDVGDEITIAWHGRVQNCKVSRIDRDVIEARRESAARRDTFFVFVVDYEVTWLHGKHEPGTPTADALIAAAALNL